MAFVRGIHRWPVNSPHKGPVTRKMFPFDDVIMDWMKFYLNVFVGFDSLHTFLLIRLHMKMANDISALQDLLISVMTTGNITRHQHPCNDPNDDCNVPGSGWSVCLYKQSIMDQNGGGPVADHINDIGLSYLKIFRWNFFLSNSVTQFGTSGVWWWPTPRVWHRTVPYARDSPSHRQVELNEKALRWVLRPYLHKRLSFPGRVVVVTIPCKVLKWVIQGRKSRDLSLINWLTDNGNLGSVGSGWLVDR